MTIADMVDRVRDFLNADVCPQIRLKQSSDDDVDSFTLVHPVAYSVQRPWVNQKNSTVQAPSITVIPSDGQDNEDKKSSLCHFRLLCLVWDPGQHTHPIDGDGQEDHSTMEFSATTEGWRDLANLIDVIRREIETRDNIGGMAVEYPIKYSLYLLDENGNPLPEFVDYRAGWVDFSLQCMVLRKKTYNHLL
jgi:hypothetical protein